MPGGVRSPGRRQRADKASAGVDLALGLLLPAVGALAAADRLHGQLPQPVPAGDGQPGKPEKEKKDSWAARVLPSRDSA